VVDSGGVTGWRDTHVNGRRAESLNRNDRRTPDRSGERHFSVQKSDRRGPGGALRHAEGDVRWSGGVLQRASMHRTGPGRWCGARRRRRGGAGAVSFGGVWCAGAWRRAMMRARSRRGSRACSRGRAPTRCSGRRGGYRALPRRRGGGAFHEVEVGAVREVEERVGAARALERGATPGDTSTPRVAPARAPVSPARACGRTPPTAPAAPPAGARARPRPARAPRAAAPARAPRAAAPA
jgi:hypothetical protein